MRSPFLSAMVLKKTNSYQFCCVVHVTANIGITEEASTGVAPIAVDDSGNFYATVDFS